MYQCHCRHTAPIRAGFLKKKKDPSVNIKGSEQTVLIDEALGFKKLICADFSGQEPSDFILVISDLEAFFINDNRTAEQSGIIPDQLV